MSESYGAAWVERSRRLEIASRRHPFPGNLLRWVRDFHSSESEGPEGPEPTTDLERATVLTSEIVPEDVTKPDPVGSWLTGQSAVADHRLVIDIDHPVKVVESSTPGHFHLYIDVPMPWSDALKILQAMADAGVVEQGYVDASDRRGYTAVRLPWVRKEKAA